MTTAPKIIINAVKSDGFRPLSSEAVTAIEMKLAYMEDFVNQIQNVAVEQTKTIDKLQKEIKLMSDKIREMSNNMEGDIPNRKPPHYWWRQFWKKWIMCGII